MRVERFLERVEIEAGARVDRNLDGLQVQSLHGLQGRMKRRSLDRDDIAGARQRLQAERQRFERAGRDDDLVHRQRRTRIQVAQRDLAAQPSWPGGAPDSRAVRSMLRAADAIARHRLLIGNSE